MENRRVSTKRAPLRCKNMHTNDGSTKRRIWGVSADWDFHSRSILYVLEISRPCECMSGGKGGDPFQRQDIEAHEPKLLHGGRAEEIRECVTERDFTTRLKTMVPIRGMKKNQRSEVWASRRVSRLDCLESMSSCHDRLNMSHT